MIFFSNSYMSDYVNYQYKLIQDNKGLSLLTGRFGI